MVHCVIAAFASVFLQVSWFETFMRKIVKYVRTVQTFLTAVAVMTAPDFV